MKLTSLTLNTDKVIVPLYGPAPFREREPVPDFSNFIIIILAVAILSTFALLVGIIFYFRSRQKK